MAAVITESEKISFHLSKERLVLKMVDIQLKAGFRVSRILKADLIIIDEIGYTPIERRGGLNHFFLSRRCKIVFRARCISTCHLQSVLQFFTPYFDLDTLTAVVNYSGSLKKNSQFVISDYCPGDSGEEPTTQYTLTVNIVDNGSVEVDDVLYTVPVTVDEGTVLDLEAIADSGWQFDGWTGDLVSGNATESITMNANKTVTATFEELTYTSESCFVDIFDPSTGTIVDRWSDYAYNSSTCGTDVVIPPTIGGDPVLHIGQMAFWDRYGTISLTSVIIPYGVTSIGNLAFYYQNNLASVTIPNSVTSIGYSAFDSNQLTSIDIPNSVTSLGYQAFSNNLLTSVDIPNSISYIDNYTFAYNQLSSITMPEGITIGGNFAFAFNPFTSLTIPNNVNITGNGTFAGYDLTSVTISDGVNIGPDTFLYQTFLTSITTGTGVTIDASVWTMGMNPGFQTAYLAEGAGTYNYEPWPVGWVKVVE